VAPAWQRTAPAVHSFWQVAQWVASAQAPELQAVAGPGCRQPWSLRVQVRCAPPSQTVLPAVQPSTHPAQVVAEAQVPKEQRLCTHPRQPSASA
jgi:hypothetical protein